MGRKTRKAYRRGFDQGYEEGMRLKRRPDDLRQIRALSAKLTQVTHENRQLHELVDRFGEGDILRVKDAAIAERDKLISEQRTLIDKITKGLE